jgi:hypothetical protein
LIKIISAYALMKVWTDCTNLRTLETSSETTNAMKLELAAITAADMVASATTNKNAKVAALVTSAASEPLTDAHSKMFTRQA